MMAAAEDCAVVWSRLVCCCADYSVNVVDTGNLLSAKRSRRRFGRSQREVPGSRERSSHVSQRLSAMAAKQVN